ncbi:MULTISPECIES: AraC family transcriptional regulator [Paenibacillus]|uniref:AraC family transcriptional regulator n=1 Tax=Paenibacillus radicis (ex Xue et al. 2023) TaxID=2972489 RepID=A0ABT1YHB6_9BACL|nr:AraC family transcriptional regulator [Paenibacillus radicis (ex Xue et al. 2023)]MCR8631618.1 AraC family transcriptional regulator [Paenibacillus radicis (ex Xue et al. 2023)]
MEHSPVFRYKDFMQEEFPIKFQIRNETNYTSVQHGHEYLQICYVLSGVCRHVIQHEQTDLMRGDLFSIPPYTMHCFMPLEGHAFELVQLDFMPSLLEETIRELASVTLNQHLLINLSPRSQIVIERLMEDIKGELEAKESYHQYAVRADLLKFLVIISREVNGWMRSTESGYEQAIREVIDYMEQNIRKPLALKEAAARISVSPNYFSSLFKMVAGVTFSGFLSELRLRKAGELLLQTEMSVVEILEAVGFKHTGHFYKMFKKMYGVTPYEYKKNDTNIVR